MKTVFITGGTGFVGSMLCIKLLEDNDNLLYVLVRGKGKKSSAARIKDQLYNSGATDDCISRVRVIEGDMESENLGMTLENRNELKKNMTAIYHCAASVKFSLSYKEAERINYSGTKEIVKLLHEAENPNFDRLHYVSTAYIAGDISEGFSENDLWLEQSFNNTYEMSKFKSEQLLQNEMKKGNPITIYRPSIISSSIDGSTHKNSIIQKLVKIFQSERIREFVCNETSSLNLVPIDYFIDGMLELGSRQDTLMKTYHLVNKENVNLRELIHDYCDMLNIRTPEFINYSEAYIKEEDIFGRFSDYIRLSHHFADADTRKALCNTDIRCRKIDREYIKKNIQYCKSHGFV